jgi:hypothetical protein
MSGRASRVRATSVWAASLTVARVPVTPMVEATYTNPRLAAVVDRSRASVDDGATRNTRSRSARSAAAIHSPASSGMRSGVMSPAPPAPARSVANRSTPYRSTGFQ